MFTVRLATTVTGRCVVVMCAWGGSAGSTIDLARSSLCWAGQAACWFLAFLLVRLSPYATRPGTVCTDARMTYPKYNRPAGSSGMGGRHGMPACTLWAL